MVEKKNVIEFFFEILDTVSDSVGYDFSENWILDTTLSDTTFKSPAATLVVRHKATTGRSKTIL